MRIKLRHIHAGGYTKTENNFQIKEVMINEEFLHPESESIAIGFRNKDSSGIIEFSSEEFDKLANSVKRKLHLVKSIRVFGSDAAKRLE